MQRKRLTPEAFHQIKAMLARGAHFRAIAKATGYSTATVNSIDKGRVDPTKRKGALPSIEQVLGPKQSGGPDPTPEEIATACEKLRRHRPRRLVVEEVDAGWTPELVTLRNLRV